MITRARSRHVDQHNNPENDKVRDLMNFLVREEVPPMKFDSLLLFDGSHPLNDEFTELEYKSALSASNAKSSPGLDTMSFEILKHLPSRFHDVLLHLFNEMFLNSRFPNSWRQTLVKFIPKAGRGIRPISLTSSPSKLFERLVQRRLEYLSETNDWLPYFQFGFRRGRSSNDAVAYLVTDIYRSFRQNESVVALALDIKGAFSAVRPDKVIDELMSLGVPSRIINFIGHMIAIKNLHFNRPNENVRVSGVGVPQGGVLSPILFSLA